MSTLAVLVQAAGAIVTAVATVVLVRITAADPTDFAHFIAP